MNNQPQSLIQYGDKVQYNLVQKNELEMRKNATNEFDENDPISLKSYLDTILPPKESTEDGQIYMQFVSCKPADKNAVIELSKKLEVQMKARNAKETGIDNNREELYSECFDELIRQVTIESLQRGELLNHVKDQMKETINYYQKLYESAMAFAMRKVLRDNIKIEKLKAKESKLNTDIELLQRDIEFREKDYEQKVKE
ncbi:MAG: dynein arm light chain [archaeon]|nr:dynein arm light chain [archaeon]